MRYLLFLLLIISWRCTKDTPIQQDCSEGPLQYYSDYFVFLSDDDSDPLVIPIDFNWSPIKDGMNQEFKGWHGTQLEWPIAYFVKDTVLKDCNIPQETWEHADNSFFRFDKTSRQIHLDLENAPEITLSIPDSSSWKLMPSRSSRKRIYAMRALAYIDGFEKPGWTIYERIRRAPEPTDTGGRDFTTFFWIPLIVDDVFYHFEKHGQFQSGARWSFASNQVTVDTTSSFRLQVLELSQDHFSGRNNIPEVVQLTAALWDLDLKLQSIGGQVGYGPMFSNGLAYYRQSLLQPTAGSISTGYGMLELILEND